MSGSHLRLVSREDPGLPSDPSWIRRVDGYLLPLAFLAALVALRLMIARLPGLAADEAYYWTWSQRLAAGYFDHPPGIAWVIRLSTALLGDTELGVRALAVILGGVAIMLLVVTARRPWLVAAAAATLPLFSIGGLMATPDVLLLFGWSIALAGVARGGAWWLLAGLGAGLAMESKQSACLLLPLLLLGRPQDLRTRWPWLAACIAFLLLVPNLLWQSQHDWVTWRFQFGHGFGVATVDGIDPQVRPGFLGILEFLGGQFMLSGPVLFVAVVAFWIAGWRDKGVVRLWWWTSFPLFAFFALASYFSPAEANWAAPAWLGAILGLGHLGDRWRRVAWVGVGVSAILCTLVTAHVVRPLMALPRDPSLQLVGGRVLGEAVQAWGRNEVFTMRYQEAAWIRFYGKLPARTLPGASRPSQFDLWDEALDPSQALYVRPWRRSSPEHVDRVWRDRQGPNTVVARDALERVAGRWQVYEVWNPILPFRLDPSGAP